MNDNNEMLPEFISESEEHLQLLNDKMLAIEKSMEKGEVPSSDDLNAMFRSTHTIKGTASFLDLPKCVDLSHKLETLFQKLRDQAISFNVEIVDVIFSCIDTLTALINTLKEQGNENDVSIAEDADRLESILKQEVSGNVSEKKEAVSKEDDPNGPRFKEKYLELFISEIKQNIEDVSDLLLVSEKEDVYTENVVLIHRILHTIKGSSGLMNIPVLLDLSKGAEKMVKVFMEQEAVIDDEAMALLFKTLDKISTILKTLEKDGSVSADASSLVSELNKKLESLTIASVKENGKSLESERQEVPDVLRDLSLSTSEQVVFQDNVRAGNFIYVVKMVIKEEVEGKHFKAAIAEERLKKKGVVIVVKPEASAIESSMEAVVVTIVFATSIHLSQEFFRNYLVIEGVDKVTAEQLENLSALVAQKATDSKKSLADHAFIRVDAKKLDALMNLSSELTIIRAQFSRVSRLFNDNIAQQKEQVALCEQLRSCREHLHKHLQEGSMLKEVSESEKDVKGVAGSLLDLDETMKKLHDSLLRNSLVDNMHTFMGSQEALQKVASSMQASVMRTRLVPIEGAFLRFERMVRDLSKRLSKNVNFVLGGLETELDKKIVDCLGEPLTHMIRNALDHGIEDKDTRTAKGKPEKASLSLKAYHQGNIVRIEVSDDGRGIDASNVASVASEKGLVSQEKLDAMNERDKLELMFMPGFSTAKNITDLSGRGVGMDVVLDMVRFLNGSIEVDSKVGKGTTFVLKIPLTLSIINALIVDVSKKFYAFPLESVVEIIKIYPKDLHSVDGKEMFKLRGHSLSLLRLEKVIHLRREQEDYPDNDEINVVVISDKNISYGIFVDDLICKDEIVIKPFPQHFSHIKGLSGASILADGRVSLILDPIAIMREAER